MDVGYTGHVQDGSGLVYAQQRYYDPQIGRFMSTDPTMPSAGDPRYFGRYQYGGNNPYKYTDPSGENLAVPLAEAGAVLGTPLGPLGSFVGAVIGGGVGYYASEAIAEAILDSLGVFSKSSNAEGGNRGPKISPVESEEEARSRAIEESGINPDNPGPNVEVTEQSFRPGSRPPKEYAGKRKYWKDRVTGAEIHHDPWGHKDIDGEGNSIDPHWGSKPPTSSGEKSQTNHHTYPSEHDTETNQ